MGMSTGMGRGKGSYAEAANVAARKSGVRLLGPNCLGIMVPGAQLNASFAAGHALPGHIAAYDQTLQQHWQNLGRADGEPWSQSIARYYRDQRNGFFETFWPNGRRRTLVQYADGVYHGEYRTWNASGAAYELKHFADGRETGRQQAWDETGALYLNYEVRDGRKYGMANAKPCLPQGHTGAAAELGDRQ